MNIIKIDSLHKLKKLLKKEEDHNDRYEFILVSEILERKNLPKKAHVSLCKFMIPDMATLNLYLYDGDKDRYAQNYFKHLSRPEIMFVLNSVISRCFTEDTNLCIVCAMDEAQHRYLDLLGEFIELNYGIKAISLKKYLDGKKSKCKASEDAMYQLLQKRQDMLYKKLIDIRISPVDILISTTHPKDIKKLDPKLQKRAKEFYRMQMEED